MEKLPQLALIHQGGLRGAGSILAPGDMLTGEVKMIILLCSIELPVPGRLPLAVMPLPKHPSWTPAYYGNIGPEPTPKAQTGDRKFDLVI